MDRFAAMVRVGDPKENKTEEQVLGIMRLHFDEGCWTNSQQRPVRRGMPVVASHTGAGRGLFLVGTFTGNEIPIPWETAPEHSGHVGHEVVWMDALFTGDTALIPGAAGRDLRWLSSQEWAAAMRSLRVREDHPVLSQIV